MLIQGGGGYASEGATAFKADPQSLVDPTGQLGFLAPATETSVEHAAATGAAALTSRRTEARMKGYEGEACPECANFTLVRNGTCLKCDTCGGTTGCS